MHPQTLSDPGDGAAARPAAWGAVLAMSLGAFVLVASEFMPIGGFWSMSAATAMRLVPPRDVPRALAVLNGGNALATVVAAPLGSYLGAIVGWCGAFFCLIPVAALALAWKFASLPALPSAPAPGGGNVFALLKRPAVALGMAGCSLFFMGQFTLFIYLRPFLETVTGVDNDTLSLLLLVIGAAGLVGTTVIGAFLKEGMYRTLAVIPQDAERGGGLMVAVVQLAIASGAMLGGLLFDSLGYRATFGAGAVVLLAAAVLALLAGVASRRS